MARTDFTLKVDNKDYKDLQQVLSKLSDIEKEASVRYGLQEGADVILKAGKSNLSSRNKKKKGNLSKSMGKKLITKDGLRVHAGFRRPIGAHAHLVDRGTKKRWTKKGAYRGSVGKSAPYTGSRFWTDSVEANGQKSIERINKAIEEACEKIIFRH